MRRQEREREAREEARRGLGERKMTARTRRERVGGEDKATARFRGGEDVARDFGRKNWRDAAENGCLVCGYWKK